MTMTNPPRPIDLLEDSPERRAQRAKCAAIANPERAVVDRTPAKKEEPDHE